MKMVTVDAEALRRVLQALVGPPHHIRELQALRHHHNTPGFDPSPIQTLLDEYNAAVEAHNAKHNLTEPSEGQ